MMKASEITLEHDEISDQVFRQDNEEFPDKLPPEIGKNTGNQDETYKSDGSRKRGRPPGVKSSRNTVGERVGIKRQDLIKKLTDKGWWLLRHGGGHDIYTDGKWQEAIARHNKIDENLVKKILKKNGIIGG
ncbi:MAG: hypothetical protein LBT13_00590 [Treponema sp.]|jgi:mRNA interferase HicA|nr:hypothetical protein [Treponema sp.]